MKFKPLTTPQDAPHMGRFPLLLDVGLIEDDDGTPICRICEIVEEREPGSAASFACLPAGDAPFILDTSYRALLLSGQEYAMLDTSTQDGALRNIANHVATRFSYESRALEERGEQKRNAVLFCHRDVVSLVASLSNEAINHDTLHHQDTVS